MSTPKPSRSPPHRDAPPAQVSCSHYLYCVCNTNVLRCPDGGTQVAVQLLPGRLGRSPVRRQPAGQHPAARGTHPAPRRGREPGRLVSQRHRPPRARARPHNDREDDREEETEMKTDRQLHIYFLLDRSGSMQSMATDVIGGFNAFLASQQADGPDALLTLVQFDSEDPHEVLA